jgi:DNA mismatch endonuclease (patch repair protein)
MSKIQGKNTSLELSAKKIMKKNGFAGFRRGDDVFGKPDFVFPEKKIAVFFDGGFWHGYEFKKIKNGLPVFWKEKIFKTTRRDLKVNRRLKKDGWKVLRFWDFQIKKYPDKCIAKIRKAMEQ